MKAQQVADKRAQGGFRFNLRWSGSIPAEQLTPEAVMKLLADYVEFSGAVVPRRRPLRKATLRQLPLPTVRLPDPPPRNLNAA